MRRRSWHGRSGQAWVDGRWGSARHAGGQAGRHGGRRVGTAVAGAAGAAAVMLWAGATGRRQDGREGRGGSRAIFI